MPSSACLASSPLDGPSSSHHAPGIRSWLRHLPVRWLGAGCARVGDSVSSSVNECLDLDEDDKLKGLPGSGK